MSGKLVQEFFECAPRDLTAAERLVYLRLAENARYGPRRACIDSKVIAEHTGLSVSTVWKALSHLARAALIQPMHKAHTGITQSYLLVPLRPEYRDVTTRPTKTKSLPPREGTRTTPTTPESADSLPGEEGTAPGQPSSSGSHSAVDNSTAESKSLPVAAKEPSSSGRPLRKPPTTSSTSETKTLTGRARFTQLPTVALVAGTDPDVDDVAIDTTEQTAREASA